MESSVAWALIFALLVLAAGMLAALTVVARLAHRLQTQVVELTRQLVVKANPEGTVPKVVERAQMAEARPAPTSYTPGAQRQGYPDIPFRPVGSG